MANIVVNVISASNLKDDDGPFNGSDPYAYLTLDGCDAQRTATVSGSSDPEWNEELTFEGVEAPASKIMKIRVYDDDWGRDDNIGECQLDLGKLIATSEPQEFERVCDDGIFSDATIKFTVTTDGSWGNPEGGSGTLTVLVKSCAGLDDADFAGTTDPYAYVTIDGCEPQQTEKQEGTINPEWNQELTFEGIENPLSKTLNIKIYDDDTWSRDDKIGECTVDLAELKMGEGSKDYELGCDFALFGLIKTATVSFTLTWEGWGDLP
jgi:Ca2+-dependent lipid-binding protein